jgi:hypothetical protein
VDVLAENEKSLVLAEEVARTLGIRAGDTVTVTVQRMHEGTVEKASIDLKVKRTAPLGAEIGYVDINLITAMEQYVQGFQVREFGWPAFAAAAADEYDGYLIFCEKTNPLTNEDLRTFRERGYVIKQIQDKELVQLYGLLIPESKDKLMVYRLAAHGGGREQWQRLRIAPSEIVRLIDADVVVVPWSDPKVLAVNGVKHRVIGFSIPERTWLKLYLGTQHIVHHYETDTFTIALPFVAGATARKASLQYANEATLALQVVMPAKPTGAKPKPAPTPASSAAEKSTPAAKTGPNAKQPSPDKPPGLPLAVVPVDLLAYLHAFDGGRVEYDAIRRLFVPTPREPTFERARLYANTIDDVPSVVDKLKERQFAVMSQSTRISEIHQQDFSLRLLVLIVGAGVFLFGVVTVVTVLLDSTERKRGTIGILRVMGVPRAAVFYMVFLRAAVIGSFAAGVTLGLGYLAGQVLGWEPSPDAMWGTWKPIIKVIIKPEDMILVVVGALACCGLGSLIPAFRASRLDPFDAIVEGRFR